MDSRQIYVDGHYFETNPTFHVEDSPWKAGQIATMLERHRDVPRSICEIGCGAGEILRQLHLRYPDIALLHGYEISPQGYALALERQGEKLKFFNSDLFADPTAHYDLALCIDVIEHVEDYFAFLRNLRKHADRFVFHVPLDMNVQMVWRAEPIRRVRKDVGHLHYFSKDTALAALEDSGYRILDWFYTPAGIDQARGLKPVLAKIPRRLLSRISPELAARVMGGYSLLVYASSTADPQA